jgi:hypothetical protein
MFCSNDKPHESRRGLKTALAGTVLLATVVMSSCGTLGNEQDFSYIEYIDGVADCYSLALRFAPTLYLHADDPYDIITIIPVFHPTKPMIAYHIFFEHDAVLLGREDADHEIVWVRYDPITLKTVDVLTLWHRTVLRTDECLMFARTSAQRPTIFVQWGQHGMLPFGWNTLMTARPRLELLVHYHLVRNLNRLPKIGSRGVTISFEGSYEDYVRFTRLIDAREYVRKQAPIVAEYSEVELSSSLPDTLKFKVKKEWPDW